MRSFGLKLVWGPPRNNLKDQLFERSKKVETKTQLVLLKALKAPGEHFARNQPECHLSTKMVQTGEMKVYGKPAYPLSLENAIHRHRKFELREERHTIF